jgi:hypothetical protein
MSLFEQGFRAELQKLAFNLTQARKVRRLAEKHKAAPGLGVMLRGFLEGPHAVPAHPEKQSRVLLDEIKRHLGLWDRAVVEGEMRAMGTPAFQDRYRGKIVVPPAFLDRLFLWGAGAKIPKLSKAEKELMHAETWAHELNELQASRKGMASPAYTLQYGHLSPGVVLEEMARMATLPKEYAGVREAHRSLRDPEHELLQKVTGGRIGYDFRPTRHARKRLSALMEEEAKKTMPEWLEQKAREGEF